jgi:AraC-like DNA-binding protein
MLPEPEQPRFPANHALRVVTLAERWDVSDGDLLSGLGVKRHELTDPDATLPVSTIIALYDRARALMREPALGWHLGLQTPLATHGYLGFAAMSAATLGDALAIAVDYAPIRSSALALRVEVDQTTAAVVIDERVDFGSVRDVILPCLLVGLWRLGFSLLNWRGKDTWSRIHLMLAEPPHFAQFAESLPAVRFRQSDNRLVFDRALLKSRLKSADPASFRLAHDQCQRIRESLSSKLIDRVKHVVVRRDGVFRSLEEVAAVLGMSPRTLRRKLREEGASFHALLVRVRRERAVMLLGSPHLSVQEVADRLGYSCVANFTRAFRQWTGETPTAYRLKHT